MARPISGYSRISWQRWWISALSASAVAGFRGRRTLPPGAAGFQQRAHCHLQVPHALQRQVRSLRPQAGDARRSQGMTPLGRFLRRSSFDELPQPDQCPEGRPVAGGAAPHAVDARAADREYHMAVDGYFARHRVKPGVTGWAQVNGWRGETIRWRRSRGGWNMTSTISRTGRCCSTSTSSRSRLFFFCSGSTPIEPNSAAGRSDPWGLPVRAGTHDPAFC